MFALRHKSHAGLLFTALLMVAGLATLYWLPGSLPLGRVTEDTPRHPMPGPAELEADGELEAPEAIPSPSLTMHQRLISRDITRQSLGDDAYDKLLADVGRARCAVLCEESKKRYFDKFMETPRRPDFPQDDETEAVLQALDKQFEPLLRDLAEDAVSGIEQAIARAWDEGHYVSWPSEEHFPEEQAEDSDSPFVFTSSTAVMDRLFFFRFDARNDPDVAFTLEELERVRDNLREQRLAAVRGSNPGWGR